MEKETLTINHLFHFLSEKQRTISIIGLNKNVGKTTLLNFLLKGMKERSLSTLVLSIGWDGESLDSVENIPKPKIMVYQGGCFLTIEELIKTLSSVEILESFEIKASGSKVILGRALQDTEIQLINPCNQKLLSKMIQQSLKRCGNCMVFIDGALDRFSHGSSALIDGVFICSGVQTDGDLHGIIEKTQLLITNLTRRPCDQVIKKLICEKQQDQGSLLIRKERIIGCTSDTLLDATELDEMIRNNDIIYTTGVITDKIIKRLFDRELKVTIVLIDGTKSHISHRLSVIMKRRGIGLQVLNRIPVYGISVNSVGIRRSMNPSKLLQAFQKAFTDYPVFDTMY